MSDLIFVVPVKDVRGAKQRLASLLPQEIRSELALQLLDQTLHDLARFAPEVDRLVVSDSAGLRMVAATHRAHFLLESAGAGETAAVERATDWTLARGYRAQAVIPADMAGLAAKDVRALVEAPRPAPSVILCPAVGDDGTNAILCAPPDAIGYRFGEGSFDTYRTRAAVSGVACRVMRLQSFVLDIDTPDDARAFIATHPENPIARWLSAHLHSAAS
ncbi:MAG: 2-phospho-L-lactate guanylyltransferase [Alphaproteobacteria bacterium]